MNYLNNLQLRGKLLVLGVLPAAILAIVLALYFTNSRLNEVEQLFEEKEKNLAFALAKSSVYGVFSGDKKLLENIIKSVIVESEILSISISDQNNNQLVHISKNKNNQAHSNNDTITISQAIEMEPADNSDEMGSLFFQNSTIKNVIGRVTIQSSTSAIKQRQNKILLNSLYITFFSLLVIAFIAYNIGKMIERPILRLSKDVMKIKSGEYQLPPLNINSKDEIASLSIGIRDMAHELETNHLQQQKKIREATQELKAQNQRLNTAQNKILKTVEAKSRFISHISHEIRTPLNGIIGFLDLIQQTKLTDEQQKLIAASIISSKNLHQIINEVLDLAQLEAGKVKLNKKNFHLKKTIEDVLSTLSFQAKESNVTIHFLLDDLLPTYIHQDPIKFGQILLNLVNNAIKFSPNSTVTLKVTLLDEAPNQLDCYIIDQGIGISEKNLTELFNDFTQFSNTATNTGSGLGLSITKSIVKAVNGTLSVKSILGKGSTFRFSFPYTPVVDSYSNISNDSSVKSVACDLSGIHILIADDNDINSELLTHILKKHNASISCTKDGQQTIESTQQIKYDLLLLDLRMPFKMGHEVLHEIRSNKQHLNFSTPAIAITAHVTSGIERANHINNFDGYLVKPIDQIELLNLIQQLLDNPNSSAESFFTPNKNSNIKQQPLALFDYQAALLSMGQDTHLVGMMVDRFISELPQQIQQLKDELTNENKDKAADIVHQIHGSAAYCGTTWLKHSAKILEDDLRSHSLEKDSHVIDDFLQQAHQLIFEKDKILILIKESPI
ncbi:MAG: hybrid sensor histidine kinase/response regulator [Piscirickettsiaceae bacterium]|nr:MAG: hybrid sensor histidine kinase/response regulator [Piscirickettsiaceae bacterium]